MKAILLALAMAGCAAPGIQISAEKAAVCKVDGCTVLTERELIQFGREIFTEGFKRGAQLGKGSL